MRTKGTAQIVDGKVFIVRHRSFLVVVVVDVVVFFGITSVRIRNLDYQTDPCVKDDDQDDTTDNIMCGSIEMQQKTVPTPSLAYQVPGTVPLW